MLKKQNSSSSAFAFWHFQNLTRKCIWHQRQSTAGVILPLRECNCLDWSSDKDATLGLA